MFNRKRLLIVTLLCVFAALPAQVFACSLIPLSVNIHCKTHSDMVGKKICIGDDCSAMFERDSSGAQLRSSRLKDSIYSNDRGVVLFDAARTPLIADAVSVIQAICTEDLSAIRAQFIQAIETWNMKGGDSRFGGNLVLTPYSAAEERRLALARDNYTDCYYAEFMRLGDWLLSNETTRSYCVVNRTLSRTLSLSFSCPTAELSSMYFLGFLLTHIDRSTLPYLAGYLLGIAVLVGMVTIVYRRGVLRAFRPTIWTILGALAGSIALSIVGSFVNFFVYLTIVYIVLCFSRGMLNRKRV
jgi:hypothetical protein